MPNETIDVNVENTHVQLPGKQVTEFADRPLEIERDQDGNVISIKGQVPIKGISIVMNVPPRSA